MESCLPPALFFRLPYKHADQDGVGRGGDTAFKAPSLHFKLLPNAIILWGIEKSITPIRGSSGVIKKIIINHKLFPLWLGKINCSRLRRKLHSGGPCQRPWLSLGKKELVTQDGWGGNSVSKVLLFLWQVSPCVFTCAGFEEHLAKCKFKFMNDSSIVGHVHFSHKETDGKQ